MENAMKFLLRLCFIFFFGLSFVGAQAPAKQKVSPTAEALAKSLTESQRAALLALLNEGDAAALEAISGIGAVRARAIIQARPFATITEVMRVDGVGEGTFAKMIAHAQAGFPQKAPAKKRTPKAKDGGASR